MTELNETMKEYANKFTQQDEVKPFNGNWNSTENLVLKAGDEETKKIVLIKKRRLNKSNCTQHYNVEPEVLIETEKEELNVDSFTQNINDYKLNAHPLLDGTFFTVVGEYFSENSLTKTPVQKVRAKCELCKQSTFIVGGTNSYFNFTRHLRMKHGPTAYNAYKSHKETKHGSHSTIGDITEFGNGYDVSENEVPYDQSTCVPVYEVASGHIWVKHTNKEKRSLSTMILDEGVKERLETDVNKFLENKSRYNQFGIPYRRTYLLHGPSGCGKTSFVFSLTSNLSTKIYVLCASNKEVTDETLSYLLNAVPDNCIILIEDVDLLFSNARSDKNSSNCIEKASQLTLSGILNCLDGLTAPENKIIFLTATSIDNLCPSLIRPGRIDVIQKFTYCNEYQIVCMFQKFYPHLGVQAGKNFANYLLNMTNHISPAQLQGYFLLHEKCNLDMLKFNFRNYF